MQFLTLSCSRVLAYIQIGTFIAVLMAISWIFSTFFFQVILEKWKCSWKKYRKWKLSSMKNFHLQSIMRSWGPTHPGSFQLSRSQYYSVLITFQPCDQKIITVKMNILICSGRCAVALRRTRRRRRRDRWGPRLILCPTLSYHRCHIFDEIFRSNIWWNFCHTIIVRFPETHWAAPRPRHSPPHLRWHPSPYPGFVISFIVIIIVIAIVIVMFLHWRYLTLGTFWD